MITTIGKVVNCIFINIGEIKLPKKGQKSGYNIECENCGKDIYQTKTQYNSAKHHFCSNKCQ